MQFPIEKRLNSTKQMSNTFKFVVSNNSFTNSTRLHELEVPKRSKLKKAVPFLDRRLQRFASKTLQNHFKLAENSKKSASRFHADFVYILKRFGVTTMKNIQQLIIY